MGRHPLQGLDDHRADIIDKIKSGDTERAILSFLSEKGIKCSESTFKRKIKQWRAENALPPGRAPDQHKDVEKAVLAMFSNPHHMPSDQEVVDALRPHFQISARTIKRIRTKNGLRRRERAVNFDSPEDLVAAVLLRLSDPTTMPKDDELAEEMNNAGFDTTEKEIFSIRHKNRIRHPCRGANRQSKHRRVTQQTPSATDFNDNDPTMTDDSDAENEPEDIPPPPPPKLTQSHHMTIITLDSEAQALLQQTAPLIKKLSFDRTKPGIRLARHPPKVHDAARPLLTNLLQSAPTHNMQVTALYISNNMLVPDSLFGCWVIPLDFHRERERIDEEVVNDIDDDEEVENWVDDVKLRIGQCFYASQPVAVHCRMTALLLSR